MTTTPKFCPESLQIHTGEISTARRLLFRLLNQLQAKADDHYQRDEKIEPIFLREDCQAMLFVLAGLDDSLDSAKSEIEQLWDLRGV